MSSDQSRDVPGVGVIGLGFMGVTHLEAWARAAADGFPNHLVAVCDRDISRCERPRGVGPGGEFRAEFDPVAVAQYGDANELLKDSAVDIVSITTPTETHVPLALAALAAGKHVLVEKPVALAVSDVARLQRAAEDANVHCMPAQCIRFWPGWDWLIDEVDKGQGSDLGALTALHIQRLSSRPQWGDGFYENPDRCGGVIFDLHVHDADLINRLLGEPTAVRATEQEGVISVAYDYGNGPTPVVAEASWSRDPALPFLMGFEATFERGRASWWSTASDTLAIERGGLGQALPLSQLSGYDGEVRHLLQVVQGTEPTLKVTLKDALSCTGLLHAVAESLGSGAKVMLTPDPTAVPEED